MALGRRSPEEPWCVGIEHPKKPGVLVQRFALPDTGYAIATSGISHHAEHILDPQSGQGARHTSVSVFATSGAIADAAATAFSVLTQAQMQTIRNGLPEIIASSAQDA